MLTTIMVFFDNTLITQIHKYSLLSSSLLPKSERFNVTINPLLCVFSSGMPAALALDTFIMSIFCSIQKEIRLTSLQHLAGTWKCSGAARAGSGLVRRRGPM